MKIIGIGNDIINIERIEKVYFRFGDIFLKRILTDSEIVNIKNSGKNIVRKIATRWAAKEAIIKALDKSVYMHDIQVYNEPSGKPSVLITKQPYDTFEYFLTLSDDFPFTIANVMVCDNSK